MNLLKDNKKFSFKLGDNNVWDTEYKCETVENGNTITTTYIFDGGLKVTNIAKKHSKHGAYEWVNYFENTGSKPTAIISELWDCDITLPLGKEATHDETSSVAIAADDATRIYAPNGSTWSEYEFYCDVDMVQDRYRVNHIQPGETKTYNASNGRSSEAQAPFFNVSKQNSGYIFAIGWTGQWMSEISRSNETVTFKSKVEDTNFRLYPGEKIRTSSVVILPYECDVIDAHNKWRRLMKEEFSLIGQPGRPKYSPLCLSVWGGKPSEQVIEHINFVKETKIPFDMTWMDAGWYGQNTRPSQNSFQPDWYLARGDWSVSPLIHPNGLIDVAEAVKDAGMGFLLWFELERAKPNSPLVSEHPEYFLSHPEHIGTDKLFNLGDEKAWQAFYDISAHYVRTLDLKCYRIDFNDGPLPYWRAADACDRKGITEIKYINGLYKFFDTLLAEFPNLIVDNCASGGRRLDVEMFKRGVSLWRSDYMCTSNYDIEGVQCHALSYNTWMPYSGNYPGVSSNKYRMRSSYATTLSISLRMSHDQIIKTKYLIEEYLRVRPYFTEDFYPLSEITSKPDTWCAWQFNRPEEGDGIVQIFRRSKSPYKCASYNLRGLDESKTYLFEDADGGEFTLTGEELANGFEVEILEKETAKLFFYKAI